MTRPHSHPPLRPTLLLLLPLALAAALQAALLPRWPRVDELNAPLLHQRLAALGVEPRPLASQTASRNGRIALSSRRRYDLGAGTRLELQAMQVRQRADFQLAMGMAPWTGGGVVRQTCLLGTGAGVTAAQLSALAESRDRKPKAALARLLGLQPNRSWTCLLVRLHSDQAADTAAAALWARLPAALAPITPP
jgi:hypothetical protein